MNYQLSRESITSFVGDVLPLRLQGFENPLNQEGITWRTEGDSILLRTFSGFSDGVLITFLAPGEAKVIATFEEQDYVCQIKVEERIAAKSDDKMNYYVGDMHIHTTNACSQGNGRQIVLTRSDNSAPLKTIAMMRDDKLLDFTVISDHAGYLNDREFFRGFADAEDAGPMDLIVFPGCEGEISCYEKDRFGLVHKNSGEIVCVNAAAYGGFSSWGTFMKEYEKSPFTVATLAHPQIIGHSFNGVWNFELDRNNSPRFRQMIKLVEMGDGTDRSSNLIHECIYTKALDNGFRVSTTCSSDSHGPVWTYDRIPGKTIVMAPEKSKGAFLDALLNNRVYASMTGNVKVRYSVNGHVAPATLPLARAYEFSVDLSYFYEDPTTEIVKCQLISNGGLPVVEMDVTGKSHFTLQTRSDTSSWYFLRLVDSQGRKTWSCPVWTGREPIVDTGINLHPLSSEGFSVVEETSGKDASVLMCGDPMNEWISEGETASILIDMKEPQPVFALGHYPRIVVRKNYPKELLLSHVTKEYPYHYVISTSLDGETFTRRAEGAFRNYGGEEIVRFDRVKARFVRLEILSTVGKFSERAHYADAKVAMGEITLFDRNTK